MAVVDLRLASGIAALRLELLLVRPHKQAMEREESALDYVRYCPPFALEARIVCASGLPQSELLRFARRGRPADRQRQFARHAGPSSTLSSSGTPRRPDSLSFQHH